MNKQEKQPEETRVFFLVIAACIIYRWRDGRPQYFIKRRRDDHPVYPGKWEVPGGKMERVDFERLPQTGPDSWDETAETTMRREIFEEANLNVGKLTYLGHFTAIFPNDTPVLGFRYFAEYECGEVVLDSESVAYAWVTAEEAKDYDFLGPIYTEILKVEGILTNPATTP